MQYTPHLGLMLPEGTDTVNLLTQMNPNTSDIDTAIYANKQAVIGSATELTAGTVHAITRANPDSDYFRFTATSNWTAGDTMEVDGTVCTVFLSDGTAPASGAYVINTEVLALLSGTRITLLTTAEKTTSLPASAVQYDASHTVADKIAAIDQSLPIKKVITKTTDANGRIAFSADEVPYNAYGVVANATGGFYTVLSPYLIGSVFYARIIDDVALTGIANTPITMQVCYCI